MFKLFGNVVGTRQNSLQLLHQPVIQFFQMFLVLLQTIVNVEKRLHRGGIVRLLTRISDFNVECNWHKIKMALFLTFTVSLHYLKQVEFLRKQLLVFQVVNQLLLTRFHYKFLLRLVLIGSCEQAIWIRINFPLLSQLLEVNAV